MLIARASRCRSRIATGWGRPPRVGEAFWLLGLFAVSIGLPFFALVGQRPAAAGLVRAHRSSGREGSLFPLCREQCRQLPALISYPVAIEPLIRLGDQTRLWSAGFCRADRADRGLRRAAVARARERPTRRRRRTRTTPRRRPGATRATWMALAAVPSGLLVAVTAHISTDVAAVPLLWVVPLALYLLTFVIVFSTPADHPAPAALMRCSRCCIVGAGRRARLRAVKTRSSAWSRCISSSFFVSALVCHGELARRRPAPRYLTVVLYVDVGRRHDRRHLRRA